MALGGLLGGGRSRGRAVVNHDAPGLDPTPGGTKSGYEYDHEGQDEKGRKMSRIAAPGVVVSADNDSQLSVGKQVELEATNAIKYRTCSWQKVGSTFSGLFHPSFLTHCVHRS